jgi:carbonic anhydrase
MFTRRAFLPVATSLLAADAPSRPQAALQRLMAGNRRYVNSLADHPNQDQERRIQVSKEQHPFAVILSCSDSRVPPEIVFDEGLGDLFVVRNAGHVVDDAVLGSIEYAVGHLGVSLVVVMGHSSCGAVKAAVEGLREAHLKNIVRSITPAVQVARQHAGELMSNAVKANVSRAVATLNQARPILGPKVARRELLVTGTHYELNSGAVTAV